MTCPVCASPEFGQVLAMAECGADTQQISEQTGLPADAVAQHLAQCLTAVQDEPDTLEKSDQRIRDLAARIAVAATSAALQGDTRSQLMALSAALRAEQTVRAALEARQAEAKQDANAPVTIASLDEIVRAMDRSTDPRVTLARELTDRVEEATTFRYLLRNPDLCAQVQELVAEHQREKGAYVETAVQSN